MMYHRAIVTSSVLICGYKFVRNGSWVLNKFSLFYRICIYSMMDIINSL